MKDINLDIRPGEFLSIVGPSGCGKSTLLNMSVGLMLPTSGEIRYKAAAWSPGSINTEIGYITQEDNLFPWRTLQGNVEFGMEVRGVGKNERRQRAIEFLERVGLAEFGDSYRHELSGGMRQRGHMARTLAYNPDVVLMDEPFGPLDVQTRLQSQELLLSLWEELNFTVVFITHDLTEAIALSDRVVVMSQRPGTIKTVIDISLDRPRDMYAILTTPQFRAFYDPLWDLLQNEMRPDRGSGSG